MLIVRNTGHRAFEGKALSQTELDHLLDNLKKLGVCQPGDANNSVLLRSESKNSSGLPKKGAKPMRRQNKNSNVLLKPETSKHSTSWVFYIVAVTPISSKISPKRSSGLRKVLTRDTPMRSLLWARFTRKASAVS